MDANQETTGVQLTLKNEGISYPRPLQVLLRFIDASGKVLAETASQSLQLLPANGQLDPLSFTIPDSLRGSRRDLLVQAVIVGSIWPSHRWVTEPQPLTMKSAWRLAFTLFLGGVLLVGGGASYQLIFRHPLVLRLSARPSNIRDLPASEAPSADKALRRARRLGPHPPCADVPPSRWSSLIAAVQGAPENLALVLAASAGPANPSQTASSCSRSSFPPCP